MSCDHATALYLGNRVRSCLKKKKELTDVMTSSSVLKGSLTFVSIKTVNWPGVVSHAVIPALFEAEAGESLKVRSLRPA